MYRASSFSILVELRVHASPSLLLLSEQYLPHHLLMAPPNTDLTFDALLLGVYGWLSMNVLLIVSLNVDLKPRGSFFCL